MNLCGTFRFHLDLALAASTNKKVQIYRFDRESLSGFVNPVTYLTPSGIELLDLTGTVNMVPYSEIKTVHFVRDFAPGEPAPERKHFLTRPKLDGLWVRMRFRDQDTMDGVLPNNLLQLEQQGFTFIPPDFSSNSQRVFVPRTAVQAVQVLGVVGSPLRAPGRRKKPIHVKDQIELFEK